MEKKTEITKSLHRFPKNKSGQTNLSYSYKLGTLGDAVYVECLDFHKAFNKVHLDVLVFTLVNYDAI